MADSDAAFELRRRARRRLIGAIALVLALVIVPPWVMDLEPKPVATNLSVEIPKQDAGRLKPPAALPSAAASAKAAAGAAPPPAAESPTGAVPRPPDVSPDTGKAGERPKAETGKSPLKPEAAKAPKQETVARAATGAPADGEAKRAQTILSGEAAYLVPLGAFANKENVKALEAKLAKAGVVYFTETVTTPAGEQTRVRAGPFSNREAAEQGRERLKTLGLSPGAVIARQ
jgi:DedD protein